MLEHWMFNWKYLINEERRIYLFDDILAKIKQLSEAEKCMKTEIITLNFFL